MTIASDRNTLTIGIVGCWISDSYGPHKVVSEYAWLWVTIFINIIACILVFLCVRGNINVHPVSHEITFSWRTSFRRWSSQTGLMGVHAMVANKSNDTMKSRKTRNREALKLIWYPLSYTILVLPMSIVRWSTLPAQPVRTMPITMAVITNFAFGLSGFVNVFIFLLTRPTLLLFGQRRGSVYEYPDHRPSPSASTDSLATTTGWLTPGSTGTPFFHKSSEMFMSRPVTPLSTDRSSVLSYPEEPYFGCPPSRSNAAVGSFSYRTDSGRRKYEDSHVDEAFFSHPIDLKRCQGQSHQGAVTRSEHGALTSENVLVRGTSQGDAMDDDTIVGYYTMEHWQLPEDCSTSRR
ncbi:hypothetical protein FRC03_012418 [Tulasnella sp. 419]|nr:hypothetical protein FRC03_012418 [Tulasnella sp. 419]